MGNEWYVRDGLREIGPLGLADLRTMARGGRLAAESPVRNGRAGAWTTAGEVQGLLQPAGKQSRSGPPPLPTSPNRLPDDTGPMPINRRRGRMLAGAENSWLIGLLSLAGIAIVGVLFVVVIAIGDGRKTPVPAKTMVQTRDKPIAQPAPIATPSVGPLQNLLPHPPKAEETSADWMEKVAERAKLSVVRIETSAGLGTGFVVAHLNDRSLLLTNKHVLRVSEGTFFHRDILPSQCTVVLPSKSNAVGQVAALAKKDEVDLALVLVVSAELQTLGPIGSFDSVREGEPVLAVGNPGVGEVILDNSVTPGIISGKREAMWLQTNALINHGNSGGPLVNKYGRVVGVNTMGVKPTEAVGINFALRADIVLQPVEWTYSIAIKDLLDEIARQDGPRHVWIIPCRRIA